jgi:plastocyanin
MLASLGETVPVQGLKNLESGSTYTFFCTLHPGMKGTPVVAP